MKRPTSKLVEEAVAELRSGRATSETLAIRYGAAWPEIEPEVQLILRLEKAGKAYRFQARNPNLPKMWERLKPALLQPSDLDQDNFERLYRQPIVKTLQAPPAGQDGGSGPSAPPTRPARPRTVRVEPPPTPLAWWRRKGLVWAAACLLVLLLCGSGVAGLAQASEPGDAFYGTKLWLDGAGQLFAANSQEKANAALVYAEHRLVEMEKLAQKGRTGVISLPAIEYRKALNVCFESTQSKLTPEQTNNLESQRSRLVATIARLPEEPVNPPASNGTNPALGPKEKPGQELKELVSQIDLRKPLPLTQTLPASVIPALTPSVTPALTPGPATNAGSPTVSLTPASIQTVATGATASAVSAAGPTASVGTSTVAASTGQPGPATTPTTESDPTNTPAASPTATPGSDTSSAPSNKEPVSSPAGPSGGIVTTPPASPGPPDPGALDNRGLPKTTPTPGGNNGPPGNRVGTPVKSVAYTKTSQRQ